ncbi:MAG: tetratricopeptide repeat protein, partial [Sandaracinus sp.]|nr:tetratricopeptide repeat protein [Sandaracinus sp.]
MPTRDDLSSIRRPLKRAFALALSLATAPLGVLSAQEPAESSAASDEAPTLGRYLDALASQRLLSAETGSLTALREQLRLAESLYFDQRHGDAALVLYEIVESPRFADYSESDDFLGAELLAASALAELGSLRTAARYLERILRRGTSHGYFGPAYRRFVDVTLQSGDLATGLRTLDALDLQGGTLPEDAENELRYLRARAAYDAGDLDAADPVFTEITQRSRFYANAQYFRGVIATRRRDLAAAEAAFCSIATTGDQERFTFVVDDRFFQVKDLAWLALGRVAHEGRRGDDAFYYYFQVPNDSERVAEALFESAFAMYEGDDYDTAIDLLDQLEVRFPASPFVDEATVLRGYVHLGRCEFEEAARLFVRFAERFGPLVAEIDAILESETRQAALYGDLLEEERRAEARAARAEGQTEDERAAEARERVETLPGLLLALLRVDPTFFQLHAGVRTLDAEAARAGRLEDDLRGLAARLGGTDAPAAAAELERYQTEADELRVQLTTAREMLAGLAANLDVLRRGGASAEDRRPLEEDLRRFTRQVNELGRQLTRALAATAELEVMPEVPAEDVRALLREDARRARRFPRRVVEMRERLGGAANDAALRSLRGLRERLGGLLRRARIGRIDAVMGSKRRIEIQIESLAAGRFPPELVDPLRVQGLLRDDEEYWPFEGEYWSDEFDETIPLDELEDEEAEAESADEDANDDEGE